MLSEDPLSLLLTPGAGPKTLRSLQKGAPLSTKLQERMVQSQAKERAAQLRREAEEREINIFCAGDPLYPKELEKLEDPPLALFLWGRLPDTKKPSIAIVGTRNVTPYGKEMARKFAKELSQAGYAIISGLARGIDTAAHKDADYTLGVMGSGFDHPYPPENRGLIENLKERGGVITEYPMSTPPNRYTFPRRNRLIAALADVVLVIEAPERSGALITAEYARALNKPLFVLPGRLDCPGYVGSHALIEKGWAKLVTSTSSITGVTKKREEPTLPPLRAEERTLLQTMPSCETSIDQLVEATNLPVTKISVLLMGLVVKGVIRELPGRLFQKSC